MALPASLPSSRPLPPPPPTVSGYVLVRLLQLAHGLPRPVAVDGHLVERNSMKSNHLNRKIFSPYPCTHLVIEPWPLSNAGAALAPRRDADEVPLGAHLAHQRRPGDLLALGEWRVH